MELVRPGHAAALSITSAFFSALVALAAGCNSNPPGDCRDADGNYVDEFLGCRGSSRAQCHADYTCDEWGEHCDAAISIVLDPCPADRSVCREQLDFNGQPSTVCQPATLDTTCGRQLLVDGKPFGADAIADLDRDGRSDLLRWDGDGTSIALANADGSFRELPPVPSGATGEGPVQTWLADVDGDDTLDLVVATARSSSSADQVTIATGRGDGTFRDPAATPSVGDAAQPIVMADVDGDRRSDVVSWEGASHQLTVLLGGKGPLVRSDADVVEDVVDCAYSDWSSSVSNAGDIDEDGFDDFVHVSCAGRLVTLLGSASGAIRLGPSQPTFGPGFCSSPDGSDCPQDLKSVLADVDGDGHLDFVQRSDHAARIHPGNGDGTFRDVVEVAAAPYEAHLMSVSDVDADGHPDLIFGDPEEIVIVRRNTGAFTFAPPKFYQPVRDRFELVYGVLLGALVTTPGAPASLLAGNYVIPASCQ